MEIRFGVVTAVGSSGNECDDVVEMYDGRWRLRVENSPDSELIPIRRQVFSVGEILILGENGREIGAPWRKPSKWDVAVEYFDSIDDAVERAEVLEALS